MTTYRGMDGFVSLGGYVSGAAFVQPAVPEGGTALTVIGNPLTGVVLAGDTFRVPGVGGLYTVGATVLAQDNSLGPIPFTPPAPAGGFPAGIGVVFLSHSIAQTRQWSATSTLQMLETTVQGDTHRRRRTGLVEWEGSFEALFDYDDPEQASLLDRYTTAKPDGAVAALSFTVSPDGPVTLYGAAVLTTLAITSPGEDLVSVTGTFQSTNQLQLATIAASGNGGSGGLTVRYTEGFETASAPLTVRYTEPFDT